MIDQPLFSLGNLPWHPPSWAKRCISALGLATLLWLAAPTAQAQEMAPPSPATPERLGLDTIPPGKRALIQQLLTMTRQEELFNQTLNLTMGQMSENLPTLIEGIAGETLDSASLAMMEADMERIITKLLTGLQTRIQFEEIAAEVYYPLYAKNFSEAQLTDLIAFYETPTGQYTIETMPRLMQDSMVLTQRQFMPAILEVLQEMLTEEFGL